MKGVARGLLGVVVAGSEALTGYVVLASTHATGLGRSQVAAANTSRTPTSTSVVPTTSTTTTTAATTTTVPPTTSTSVATTTTTSLLITTNANSRITVRVANATTINGLAGKVTDFLAGKGYDVVAPVNANSYLSATTIYYAPGFLYSADSLAEDLALSPASVAPYSSSVPLNLPEEDITVLAGPDLSILANG